HVQESECTNDPVRQPNRSCAPARLERFGGCLPGVCFATGVHRQLRPQAVRQEQRGVATELAGALHGVLGDQTGLDEVATTNAAQHHVLGDEDELAFLTLFHAAAPD